MSARALITISLVAAGVLAPAANADAAKKKKASVYPTITKIAPMKVSVGDTMTITGTGFLRGKGKNTVAFKRSGKPSVFVKADGLSTTTLRLTVPTKVTKVLGASSTGVRFQLRVLAKRFGKSYTPLAKSPMLLPASSTLITPTTPGASAATPLAPAAAPAPAPAPPAPNCDGDAQPDSVDVDDDNDLLPDVKETALGLNRCAADTDEDGMDDGWEYQSALDWDQESCPAAEYPTPCSGGTPYPGKRPYPNPLQKDQNIDHDSDGLPAWFEYKAWKAHGVTHTLDDLWYSDGQQASQDTDPNDGCVGLKEIDLPDVEISPGVWVQQKGHVDKYPTGERTMSSGKVTTFRYGLPFGATDYSLDRSPASDPGHGCLTDDERDEDGDFLSNDTELIGVLSGPQWIRANYSEPPYDVVWSGTDPLDGDTDGNGVVDGLDDQDGDDFWNIEEQTRGRKSARPPTGSEGNTGIKAIDTGVRTGLWTDPYNPCLPSIYSKFCKRNLVIGKEVWMPFYNSNDPNAEPPVSRWPLYNHAFYNGYNADLAAMVPSATPEIWRNAVAPNVLLAAPWLAKPTVPAPAEQGLPPQQPGDPAPGAEHPLPRPAGP